MNLTRRGFLQRGVGASAFSLATQHGMPRAVAATLEAMENGASNAHDAGGVRERLLFDFGWRFTFGHGNDPARDLGFGNGQGDFAKVAQFKFAYAAFDDSAWRRLDLPHDWAVELPFVNDPVQRSHGFKPMGRRYPETSVGWYRRTFDIPAADLGRRITVEFDGVFRSVLIFVNGCFVGRNDNGYVPFQFDLTDFLHYGEKNAIVVRVDASFGDGWFYEGAGIYRHVWLTKTDNLHLKQDETFVRTQMEHGSARLLLSSVVENHGAHAESAEVSWEILDSQGRVAGTAKTVARSVSADSTSSFAGEMVLKSPALWSMEEPHLYTAVAKVVAEGRTRDVDRTTFGVRTVRFDADHGFFLNDKPVKIKGTCNHQDHAGVGAALPDGLQWYRLAALRAMGSNAVRTSHNMPTPEWVEACDRMGMMMMCETRQMSANPEALAQLEAMVKRYRNSPSIILWSIGNEEDTLQTKEKAMGARIASTMVRRVHVLDPTRLVSAAVNGTNEGSVSEPLDVIGFNYNERYPDGFHRKYPSRPIIGSETASTTCTRGVYATDKLRNTVTAYDLLGSETAEGWWKYYAEREWMGGGFAWTGFDYRGEPTPYAWPSISSQFGIMDMCGFPKDIYFYYKSWWGNEPVLHVLPHWNFEGREGEVIPVWVYSNLEEVELLLNGKSLGTQKMPALGHLEWKVPYRPGTIEARGRRAGAVVLTTLRETTSVEATLRVTADRTELRADGEDVAILRVEVLDKEGRPVPTAANPLAFHVSGEGRLIGVGNGDPNCQESDKEPKRSLFNGLAQIIMQASKTPGSIQIEVTKDGTRGPSLQPASISISTKATALRPAVTA